MAKVTVGILTSFSHEVQEWSVYKARLEQWFLANDVVADSDKAGTKRRAILLSNLAESTYKLVRDLALPKEVGTLSYDEVVQLFDGHFRTKKCTFAERWKFHSATQHMGEGLSEWAARVRSLATHCGFKAEHLDEQLRDRFVLGLESGPERDTLFTKDLAELTLSSALDMAEGLRCARAGAHESLQRREAQMPLQVLKVSMTAGAAAAAARAGGVQQRGPASAPASAPSGGRCSVCGYQGHQASTCRFARYKCRKCGVQGHLKRMCNQSNGQHFVERCEAVDDDDIALDNCVKSKQCLQSDNYRGNRKVDFKVDDVVLVKLFNQQKHYWARGVIDKKVGKSLYLVRVAGIDQPVKRHANQLLRYKGGDGGGFYQEEMTDEIVPAFIIPVEQSGNVNTSGNNSTPSNQVENNPDDWFDCGDDSGQADDVTAAAAPLAPECEPANTAPQQEVTTRSKRTRTVVDYKKFFLK
ncbi:hypothetical protein ABMA27_004250 [Loxostege sticticalis]|uniref:CCHC-type domain-containing protein n=1 Tax=Loxostege sticticalis TaxID=481309 RepID=A0ABR3HMV9_LOXSC